MIIDLADIINPTDLLGNCSSEEKFAKQLGIILAIKFEHLPKGSPWYGRLIANIVFDDIESMNYYKLLNRYRPSEDIRFVVE